MPAYSKQLEDKDGNILYPITTAGSVVDEDGVDLQTRVEDAAYIGTGSVGTLSPWVGTSDIVDGAVTSDKIDFSTFVQNNFSPSADTTAAWISGLGGDGVYWIYYNVLNKFATQPSQWGFLEVIIWANNITQIWHEHTAANILVRGGNNSGWNNQGWHTP